MDPLTNAQVRDLKAQAQRLKVTLKIGKEGLSPQFLTALDEVLKHHELVKVKFDEFKEQKKELAPTACPEEPQPSGHPGWQCGCALSTEAS
jgi:RNA-binding protein YhbY